MNGRRNIRRHKLQRWMKLILTRCRGCLSHRFVADSFPAKSVYQPLQCTDGNMYDQLQSTICQTKRDSHHLSTRQTSLAFVRCHRRNAISSLHLRSRPSRCLLREKNFAADTSLCTTCGDPYMLGISGSTKYCQCLRKGMEQILSITCSLCSDLKSGVFVDIFRRHAKGTPCGCSGAGTDIFDLVHYAEILKSDFSVDIFKGMN
jgi:hypothetical protein